MLFLCFLPIARGGITVFVDLRISISARQHLSRIFLCEVVVIRHHNQRCTPFTSLATQFTLTFSHLCDLQQPHRTAEVRMGFLHSHTIFPLSHHPSPILIWVLSCLHCIHPILRPSPPPSTAGNDLAPLLNGGSNSEKTTERATVVLPQDNLVSLVRRGQGNLGNTASTSTQWVTPSRNSSRLTGGSGARKNLLRPPLLSRPLAFDSVSSS